MQASHPQIMVCRQQNNLLGEDPYIGLQVEGRPVVCFAGEATHRRLTGTMGAAFLTGQREARRLLAAYCNS